MVDRTKRLVLTAAAALMAAAAAAAPAAAQEHRDIMPPISGEGAGQTYAQAVWVVIIFVILLVILYPTAWKNVLAGLKKREDKIRADIADAEAARTKAEASLVDYNKQLATAETQVRELLARAATDAERIATNIKMRAQQDAEEAKERAVKDIEASKQQALSEIYEQTASLATGVAEKILRREIKPEDQTSLVEQTLKQMQTAGA